MTSRLRESWLPQSSNVFCTRSAAPPPKNLLSHALFHRGSVSWCISVIFRNTATTHPMEMHLICIFYLFLDISSLLRIHSDSGGCSPPTSSPPPPPPYCSPPPVLSCWQTVRTISNHRPLTFLPSKRQHNPSPVVCRRPRLLSMELTPWGPFQSTGPQQAVRGHNMCPIRSIFMSVKSLEPKLASLHFVFLNAHKDAEQRFIFFLKSWYFRHEAPSSDVLRGELLNN